MKNKKKKFSIIAIFSVIVLLVLLAVYNQKTQQNLNRQVQLEVTRRNHLIKFFRGTKFTYQSRDNRIKKDGIEVQSSNMTSMHVFDFTNMTVTNTSHIDGRLQKTTYNIANYSKERGRVSIHILKIESLGLKEIRLNPEVNTIEYYYDNGNVSLYKNITREMSYDLVSPDLQAN